MIPNQVRAGAVDENLQGARQQFTIAANGKAFRTLIDGLYSNKIRAVIRELWSNAFDSHIAAGTPDKPFHCSIPTSLDPTFRVRDFGTSLSHEDVMHLYTTIFQSSKEESNTQVGMLGLGSKSPFAYTDSFSVTAWLNGEKRIYVAFIEGNGVPSITHLQTVPSDEPTGIEVSFPANRHDVRQFQTEAQFVLAGFKVAPVIDGMEASRLPVPRLYGTDWAIYPSGSIGGHSGNLIRQGCVVYPNSDFPVRGIGYNWVVVIDVPIGTADVTASRESLSFDPATRQRIVNITKRVYDEVRADVDAQIAAATTRYAKAEVFKSLNGVFSDLRGSAMVSLAKNEADRRLPTSKDQWGYQVANPDLEETLVKGSTFFSKTRRQTASQFDVSTLHQMRVLINRPEIKIVRRQKRIADASFNYHTWVLNLPAHLDPKDPKRGLIGYSAKLEAEAVAWIKECLGLKDSQFIKVETLPDNPPPKTTPKPRVTKVYDRKRVWAVRFHGNVETLHYGKGERQCFPKAMRDAAERGGVKLPTYALDNHASNKGAIDVLYVTPKERDRLKLDPALRVDNIVKAAYDRFLKSLPLDDAYTVHTVTKSVGYGTTYEVIMEEFFPAVTIKQDKAQAILNIANEAKIDLTTRPIAAKVKAQLSELNRQFPLLFGQTNKAAFKSYINNNQKVASNT